ncbi:MAG: hypothetical protein KJP02_03345 [Octadecabacter sp.]|nr:hypothetical protein [Octadecabacter sp.]
MPNENQNEQMKDIEDQDLLTGVLGALYEKLTMGNDDALRDGGQFLAWEPVGIACTPEGMRFMQGLMGEGEFDKATRESVAQMAQATKMVEDAKAAADENEGDTDQDPGVLAAISEADKIYQREKDSYERLVQAAEFSRMLNKVPAVPEFEDGKARAMILHNPQNDVISVYQNLLRMSETASYKISEKDKAKIERLRGLFWEKFEEEDLITEEKVTKWRKSRLMTEYERCMMDYEVAMMAFQNAKAEAASGRVAGAAARFAMTGPILQNKVRFARDQWETSGRKTDVEKVAAYIGSVGMRDAGLIKADLLARMESTKMLSPMGGEFYMTTLTPSSFLDEDAGWLEFSFSKYANSSDHSSEYKNTETKAGGALVLPIGLSIGGRGSKAKQTSESRRGFQAENFHFKCEYTMVNIDRGSFFDRAFVQSNMWRFPDGMDPISDGGEPPTGQMPAITTRAILVRNLEMRISFRKGEASKFAEASQTSGGGGVAYGPFVMRASHSVDEGESGGASSREGQVQTLRSEGMMIAGYMCDTLPMSPNPLDDPAVTWGAPDIAINLDEPELV